MCLISGAAISGGCSTLLFVTYPISEVPKYRGMYEGALAQLIRDFPMAEVGSLIANFGVEGTSRAIGVLAGIGTLTGADEGIATMPTITATTMTAAVAITPVVLRH
jgi:hypothetical protein